MSEKTRLIIPRETVVYMVSPLLSFSCTAAGLCVHVALVVSGSCSLLRTTG